MIELDSVKCGYGFGDVVKDVSLSIKKGERVCLIGPNGCGKTTLLKAISNIIDYDGAIKIDGEEVKNIKRKDLGKKIGLLTQISSVYFSYSVFDTVLLGRYPHINGIFSAPSKKDKQIAIDAIESVGISDIMHKNIDELSGGQLQRVFLARTFAQDPEIIILDEPTNHLDLKWQIELIHILNDWCSNKEKTLIGVFHDLNLVNLISDRVYLMKDGKIVLNGCCKDVLHNEMLNQTYEIDVKEFMKSSLKNWVM